ncbi:hypothetical protein H4R33_004920 [Dimargaris cristalligena]|nr:hypothetical protein H4R33_004920 [Dimargaris cristalligena]
MVVFVAGRPQPVGLGPPATTLSLEPGRSDVGVAASLSNYFDNLESYDARSNNGDDDDDDDDDDKFFDASSANFNWEDWGSSDPEDGVGGGLVRGAATNNADTDPRTAEPVHEPNAPRSGVIPDEEFNAIQADDNDNHTDDGDAFHWENLAPLHRTDSNESNASEYVHYTPSTYTDDLPDDECPGYTDWLYLDELGDSLLPSYAILPNPEVTSPRCPSFTSRLETNDATNSVSSRLDMSFDQLHLRHAFFLAMFS